MGNACASLSLLWQILYKMSKYSMLTQKKEIVAATMVLHNLIHEHSSSDVDFVNCDRDPDFVPAIPDRYNKYAVSSHTSDDLTFEASFLTIDAFHDSLATSLSLV
jgi:hypothetical protein